MYQSTDPSKHNNQNSCMGPFINVEVLLLLLVLGFIIYKLMNPMSSMNLTRSCFDLDLTATPMF